MIMSHVARTFIARHCTDVAVSLRYARITSPGMYVASVVTDAPASFASSDKVIGAHMYQLGSKSPWTLTVSGSIYSYVEQSIYKAVLTIYDADLSETTIAYAENHLLTLSDIIASANGQAPFYISQNVIVQRISRETIEHPYRQEACTALKFSVDL